MRVAADFDDVDFEGVDCAIVTTSSDLRACAPTFRALLEAAARPSSARARNCRGRTCGTRSWRRELDRLARKHGGRLLGTGVNPGFLMDAFPVAATAISKSVTQRRSAPLSGRVVAAHPVPEEDRRRARATRSSRRQVKAGTLRHVGLGESLHFIAHQLGLQVDALGRGHRAGRARRASFESGSGPVKKGAICGVRQEARGFATAEGSSSSSKFQASIGLADPHDRVIVEGVPKIDLDVARRRARRHRDVGDHAQLDRAAARERDRVCTRWPRSRSSAARRRRGSER